MTVAIIFLVGSFQTAARIAPRSKFLAPPGVANQGVEAAVLSRNRLDLRVKTRVRTCCVPENSLLLTSQAPILASLSPAQCSLTLS
jgi:hypothetical protein